MKYASLGTGIVSSRIRCHSPREHRAPRGLRPIMLHHRILPRRHHSFVTPLHNLLLISSHGLPERLATIMIILQCPPDVRGIANGLVQPLATVCSHLANSTSAPIAGEGTYGMSLDAPRPLPGPRCRGGYPTQDSAIGPSDRSSGWRCCPSRDSLNVGAQRISRSNYLTSSSAPFRRYCSRHGSLAAKS